MSKLNIDQQTIKEIFSKKGADYLIPDYQRPYAWGEVECETLWDDIFSFAFPDNDYSKFDQDDEYFLGPIVTFRNKDKKLEIIDGQQRLTTLLLLLRAFYAKLGNMKDSNSVRTRNSIANCIWKTDEFENPNKEQLKIDSEVASDDDKDEFLNILKAGIIEDKMKSQYALNYRFFQKKLNDFLNEFPSYFAYLPTRLLNNCILLPIEAESQNTALRIFSTLNDRGKPLSDTDIFKSQFYRFFTDKGQKQDFIKRWKKLEELSDDIFSSNSGSSMDELFTRYMYYARAINGNKQTTTAGLRKFYETNNYALLRDGETLKELELLADFWAKVVYQDDDYFSERVLKRLFVLHYAPNSMWTYLVSVYFLKNKDSQNKLDEEAFYQFLNKIIAFIWAYALERPGVNQLRGPAYEEMINIVNNKPVTFQNYRFEDDSIKNNLETFVFTNQRPITKSYLAWWAFTNPKQQIFPNNIKLDIEHIYAKKREETENSLKDHKNLESLGNKALLEKSINIRAADYKFTDKKRYYVGYRNSFGKEKSGTKDIELQKLAKLPDFTERDIISRKEKIINTFIDYLRSEDLLII